VTSTPVPSDRSSRLFGLDALRGVAVLLMIEQHMGIWLWKGPDPGRSHFDYPLLAGFNALGGGAAPLFVTLAGIGSSLMITKRQRSGRPVDLTLIRRGLVLMAFGLLLNLMTPSWFTWRSWFVLHLMGFGMLITPALRRLPTRALVLLALAILVATPAVQIALKTPLDLSNLRMAGVAREHRGIRTFVDLAPLRVALAQGQFPIFGWLSFFVAGLAAGRAIAEEKTRGVLGLGALLLGLGLVATLAGLGGGFARGSYPHLATRMNVPFFPASPALLALLAGAVLLLIGLVLRFDGKWRLHAGHPMVTLGRGSLTLLLAHVYLFRELSRPVGAWRAMEAGEALATLGTFTLLAFVACWLWQRVDYRFGAEWLLRKLAP
jgi:uncharacterized membrane protein